MPVGVGAAWGVAGFGAVRRGDTLDGGHVCIRGLSAHAAGGGAEARDEEPARGRGSWMSASGGFNRTGFAARGKPGARLLRGVGRGAPQIRIEGAAPRVDPRLHALSFRATAL